MTLHTLDAVSNELPNPDDLKRLDQRISLLADGSNVCYCKDAF